MTTSVKGAGLHHIGASVASLDVALEFWAAFLGVRARSRALLSRPYLGLSTGYPGVVIEVALLDLPGVVLELLAYRYDGLEQQPEATCNPGHVHLCLRVDDADTGWRHAVAAGARPMNPDGPVLVDAGPNEGARVCYLRIHDGISLELFQPATGS